MSWREGPTALVARREIREATRAKSFKITLAVTAAVLAAIIVIAKLSSGGGDDTERVVVAGADSSDRVEAIEQLGAAIGVQVDVTTAPDDEAAAAAVADGDADIAVSADGTRLTTKRPVELDDGSTRASVINVLRSDLALDNGLRAAGLTPEQAAAVRSSPPPDVDALEAPEDQVDTSRTATATITNVLLFLLLQSYGQWVVTAVTREKASRVVEVLLAVIRPRQLLVGKVVGIGLVALLHAAVLIAVALVTTRVMDVDVASGIAPGDLALSAVWFLLGYSLYCGAYAAAGSLVSRVEDAQSVAFPVMLPLLFGYIVSFSVAGGANTLLWVLAFIPPTAVVAMPTLYAAGEAPLWAVGISMALTVVAIIAVMALAARIYERSVLRTGRKMTWREAFRSPREIETRTPVTVD